MSIYDPSEPMPTDLVAIIEDGMAMRTALHRRVYGPHDENSDAFQQRFSDAMKLIGEENQASLRLYGRASDILGGAVTEWASVQGDLARIGATALIAASVSREARRFLLLLEPLKTSESKPN